MEFLRNTVLQFASSLGHLKTMSRVWKETWSLSMLLRLSQNQEKKLHAMLWFTIFTKSTIFRLLPYLLPSISVRLLKTLHKFVCAKVTQWFTGCVNMDCVDFLHECAVLTEQVTQIMKLAHAWIYLLASTCRLILVGRSK